MPTLTFQVPRSAWAILEENARREGVSVRALVQWQIKTSNGLNEAPRRPAGPTEDEPAAA